MTSNTERRPPTSSLAKHLVTSGHKVDLIQCFNVLVCNVRPKVLAFSEAMHVRIYQLEHCLQKSSTLTVSLTWH